MTFRKPECSAGGFRTRRGLQHERPCDLLLLLLLPGFQVRLALAQPDHDAGHAQHRYYQAHHGNQDAPRQPEDAARVHRELCLHEDIGGRALPGLADADEAPVDAIDIQDPMSDAA